MSAQLRPAPSATDAIREPPSFARRGGRQRFGAPEPTSSPASPMDSAGWVVAALEATLRSRAPGVYASTPLVGRLADRTAKELGLDTRARTLLDVAVRTRDIGMISLPDAVVLATATLSPTEWQLVNTHPVIGAALLEGLMVVAPAAMIVRAHHERWDGGGYPDGRRGDDIPLLSRIIATCDAFAATAGDRPHRRGLGSEAALALLCQDNAAQFDPATVKALVTVLARERRPAPPRNAARRAAGTPAQLKQGADGQLELADALSQFDVVPALAPAVERALAAAVPGATPTGELVNAVESDMGLTVAVLRRAQPKPGGRPIANVPDAVMTLGPSGVAEVVETVPRSAFPWRTSPMEALMHRSLVHAQAVARASDRIARELGLTRRDDLLVAALLHDVGKLVLTRAHPDYVEATDRTESPEVRTRREREAWGIDHAGLGGILIRRWGLSEELAGTVAAHHRAEDPAKIATHVRLADMTAHHAQGDAIDRKKLLQLAHLCGLSAAALREILFDLPHAGGSHQRRAERSPLSRRQSDALRGLADGKVYKEIAVELGTSASTVRSHLHNVYRKLGVADRAQAVLRATEMGWI